MLRPLAVAAMGAARVEAILQAALCVELGAHLQQQVLTQEAGGAGQTTANHSEATAVECQHQLSTARRKLTM